jgi:MOSC domain-containing protein YiiM
MGENISARGMLEDTVYIGDQYQWGDAIIEVSQPRSPCFKLSQRWDIKGFAIDMQEISRCGWLYRVIQEGNVSDQDALILIHRPSNALNIKQTSDIFFSDPLNPKGLKLLKSQQALSISWRGKVEQRLSQGIVENWNFRLLGHK